MIERTRRERVLTFLLTPAVVLAVTVLGVITYRTSFQLERLRERSVIEATLSLANEKSDRLDKRIIEEDNVIFAETETTPLGRLAQRWLPTAARETPTVRAVLVLDPQAPNEIFEFASRAPGPEDDVFRRILVQRILPNLDLGRPPLDQLRHLHKVFDKQSYLVSYWQREYGDKQHLIVAWHDVPRIVHDLFPRVFAETTEHARMNVVDEEGRIVFGPAIRGTEFTVGRPFETTLYGWRLQVALTAAQELGVTVERRRTLELIMVAASFLVVVCGVVIVVFAAERERRLAAIKSDFVANVSHELKTPLSLIRMFGELLATRRIADEKKQQQYLSIIVNESERLSSLIDNVLDFARLERGRAAYTFHESDLGEVVSRAVEMYRYRAEREGVEIGLTVSEVIPIAMLDERAIELVIVNLLDNAIKYAKESKLVDVYVESRSDRLLQIRVVDSGPGIALEDQRRIFDRFVRGRGARDKQVRGSGIGLALVKHIARSHGGDAWVESELGRGSTFFVTVALKRASEIPPARPAHPATEKSSAT